MTTLNQGTQIPTPQAYNAYLNSYLISAQRPVDRFSSTQPLLIQTLPLPDPRPTAYGAPPSWRSRGAIEPATATAAPNQGGIDAATARQIGNAVVTSIGQGQAGSAWLSNGGTRLDWKPENCCFVCRKVIGMRKHYCKTLICWSIALGLADMWALLVCRHRACSHRICRTCKRGDRYCHRYDDLKSI